MSSNRNDAEIIDGKSIAKRLETSIRERLSAMSGEGRKINMANILVGDKASSELYTKSQQRVCDSLGIGYKRVELKGGSSTDYIIDAVRDLNADDAVQGIMVQMPLPEKVNCRKVIDSIDRDKDVEGVHSDNLGALLLGDYSIAPCTAKAIHHILSDLPVDLEGAETVIVGHSNIVGKPLSLMMMNELSTTTVCHIATSKRGMLSEHTVKAEILIVAVGNAGLITADMVSEGVVVIDAGINCSEDRVCGDVDFDSVRHKASYITPVPGGVGPVTMMMLMDNLINCAKKKGMI